MLNTLFNKSAMLALVVLAASATATGAEEKIRPGIGTPPPGVYNCEKISGGQLIGLGKLEIKGNTYRGFCEEGHLTGNFYPFTVSGANKDITWSHGIDGFPAGWKLTTSRYVGNDSKGKPMMEIRYISKSGWSEVIDAVKD